MSGSIGGIDASIPLSAGRGITQPINPLAAYGDYARVQQLANQNKLFPGQQQLQQQEIQGGQQALASKKLAAVSQFLAPHLNESVNHDRVTTLLAQAQAAGLDTGPFIAQMATAPNGDGPEYQQAFVNNVGAGALTGQGQNQINYLRPGVGPTINQGDAEVGTSVAPQSAPNVGAIAAQPTGAVPVGRPSPAALIQPTAGPMAAGGGPTVTTLGNFAHMNNLDPATGQPIPRPEFANLPPGLRNPNAPAPVVAPMQTGLGPAQQAAAGTSGTQSSTAYQNISDLGVKANAQRGLLQSMAADAQAVPVGPGTSQIRQVQSLTQTMFPKLAQAFGVDPAKLAAGEDLDKVANQLADAQGAGSDARLAVNQGANPSNHNTPAGLSLILSKLVGNTDYLAARQKLASQYQQTVDQGGTNNRQFEVDVGSKLDPRVFQYNAMQPAQKFQYLSEIKDPEAKTAFKKAYFTAEKMGVLPNGATP